MLLVRMNDVLLSNYNFYILEKSCYDQSEVAFEIGSKCGEISIHRIAFRWYANKQAVFFL